MPTRTFRQLLEEPGLTVIPGVASALAARIAEDLGFEAIGLGGYAMGAHLGFSEPLLSLEDVAICTRYVTRASSLPLLVDAGLGWGGPAHVAHTVNTLEHAGAAGIHVEDQLFPKPFGHPAGIEHIITADEMEMKIKAAVSARRDDEFLVVARTDAMGSDSFEEGLRRGQLYFDAGADVVMCFPQDEEETKRVPNELPGVPLMYVNSDGNHLARGVFGADELEFWGWRFLLDSITTTHVTARAVHDVLQHLRQTGRADLDQRQARVTRKFVEDTIVSDDHA